MRLRMSTRVVAAPAIGMSAAAAPWVTWGILGLVREKAALWVSGVLY